MDGPRGLNPSELPSVLRLVNTVFFDGDPRMGTMFSLLFSEKNADNLLVYEDQGKIVSHVGMTLHQAVVGGCEIGVACIGAVATYEEYRGRGLASNLMDTAIRRALDHGASVMLISGTRGLYRRLGAVTYGLDHRVEISAETADRLSLPDIEVHPFEESHLSFWKETYKKKEAHFVRTEEEWESFMNSGYCMCRPVEWFTIFENGKPTAYCVIYADRDDDCFQVFEFAGTARAVLASLRALFQRFEKNSAILQIQAEDRELKTLLEEAGAELTPCCNPGGTVLLLDTPKLIRSVQPLLAKRSASGDSLEFHEQDGVYHFNLSSSADSPPLVLEGKGAVAQLVFGSWDRAPTDHPVEKLFPIPSLTYGLNFV